MSLYLQALSKYATFGGRARRMEYWMFTLINWLIGFAIGFFTGGAGEAGAGTMALVGMIFWLAILIPSISVGVRRMHDTDHSGWWILLPLVNLVFALMEGTKGSNRFGPDPKA
jgi:uncharacterized membrane protein YhaH (DUF805 family)